MAGDVMIHNTSMLKVKSYLCWSALTIGAVWLLADCAGNPPPSPTSAAPGLFQLPPPSALVQRDVQAKASSADIILNGADYDTLLPNNRIEAEGTQLWFHSNWTDSGKSVSDVAYATYTFSPGFQTGEFSISTGWSNPPDDGQFWIGLADNSTDKWRWFLGSASQPLVLSDMSQYMGMHTQLNVVIAILNLPLGPPPPEPLLGMVHLQAGT